MTETNKQDAVKNDKIQQLITKVSLMQKLKMKQAYSRPVIVKRYQDRQQRLYAFLGQGLTADWEPSQIGDNISQTSHLTINSIGLDREIRARGQPITYQLLLQHIQNAESNYEVIRNRPMDSQSNKMYGMGFSRQGSL